jgi:Phytanoyl-CoA dioxygenase (PhyH)
MSPRHTAEQMQTWRQDGAVVIERFFNDEEVAAVVADFELVFGRAEGAKKAKVARKSGEAGRFHPTQFTDIKPVPVQCSPALNLIGVHPAILAFAREALGTRDVHCYQCQAWAKFTGDSDYDQPLHCDFVNHTLTVPSEFTIGRSITILCYFTDVSDEHGAMRYVTKPDSLQIAPAHATLNVDPDFQSDLQAKLAKVELSSAAPAGSIVPYGIDVWHRGANLTAPGGRRFALMTCFRAGGNDQIGFHAWPVHHMQPWANIFNHATPDQLTAFGVLPPGHRFWTAATIEAAQSRYPGWDLTPYRNALQ